MPRLELNDAGLDLRLDAGQEQAFERTLADWEDQHGTTRLLERDASLWTAADEAAWLGWLAPPAAALLERLDRFAETVRRSGFADTLLLGMGGSSLAPEVLADVFGAAPGHPRLTVLDATDPAQIRRVSRAVGLDDAQIIVASKSGGTTETNLLLRHALAHVRAPGRQVVAVTDPGSSLETLAAAHGFAAVFHGDPSVGGRFSALTAFGLVPAAALGIDRERLLGAADGMRERCSARSARSNPGVALGLVIAALAHGGRDKLTLVASPALRSFPAWIEQLVAESLGKRGRGMVPLEVESPAVLREAHHDRVFVSLRLASEPRPALPELAAVDIALPDRYALGAEFFRWEFATAVAGAALGVNPFDQPDVEAAKVAARAVLAGLERGDATATASDVIRIEADALAPTLRRHLDQAGVGDYIALLAFVDREPSIDAALTALRARLQARRGVAVTLGYGPRYLHSTGQLHKGGPNRGVFLCLTADDAPDLEVPGQRTTFGAVKLAQACGDLQVLAARGRRVLRVHLGADIASGLRALDQALR